MSNIIKSQNPFIQIAKRNDIKQRFEQVLGNPTKAASFIATLINITNENTYLQKCDPNTILGSAMIAATLDLPVNPNLGLAYIIPYKDKAQFQLGYKGFIQLAMRSGQYKTINVSEVYEDELEFYNPLTGEVKFTDIKNWEIRKKDDGKNIIGYYAFFELFNGFKKEIYMNIEEIKNHAHTYSASYRKKSNDSLWTTNFHAMGLKTVLKQLLSKWGVLSVEMQRAIQSDQGIIKNIDSIDDVSYDDVIEGDIIKENKKSKLEEKLEKSKGENNDFN
jgi:recombination protein RecT